MALLAVAVLLLVSLVGYHSSDPPSDDYVAGRLTQNPCGLVGAYLSHYLLYGIGYAAYALAGLLLLWGWLLLMKSETCGGWLARTSAIVLVVALAGLLSPAIVSLGSLQNIPSSSGYLGLLVGRGMIALLARPGSFIVLLALVLVSLYYSTDALAWHALRACAQGAWKLGGFALRALAPLPSALRRRLAKEPATPAFETQPPLTGGERAQTPQTPAPPEPATPPEPLPVVLEKFDIKPPSEGVRPPAAKPRKKPQQSALTSRPDGEYELPSVDLLDFPEVVDRSHFSGIVREQAEKLQRTLSDFGIVAQVVSVQTGPVITQYELALAPGTKVQRVYSLSDDIAMALKAPSVRVVAPIPGRGTVGVEVPNAMKAIVRLRELMTTADESKLHKLQVPFFLGKDAAGVPLIFDLTEMPHLLIAGCTGSGKSVCLNSVVMSVLMTRRPDEVKFILIDPKMVELSSFGGISHLMCPVVTDMTRAAEVLGWAVNKMDERYVLLSRAGVKHIRSYNRLSKEEIRRRLGVDDEEEDTDVPYHLPHILILVDELADLMFVAAKEVEEHVTRLAQKSRAVGIHVVLATQRPSVDVITGLIKSNLPARISFQVSAKVDSRTILDQNGAEKLLGEGDMLFLPPATARLVRAQGTYVSEEEIGRVLEACIETGGQPEYNPELVQARKKSDVDPREEDELYDEALRLIVESGRGSVSLLQRALGVGYTRAARLIDLMYDGGVVGEYKGSMAREVLMTPEELQASIETAQPTGEGPLE
ncbi:MAG: DNA translocase FtsK [Planctomycetota bacterium]